MAKNTVSDIHVAHRHPILRRLLLTVGVFVGLSVIVLTVLVAVPVISPSAGAQLADTLRSIFGPQPVAELESISFQIQDVFNRTRYQLSGDQPQISFADPSSQSTALPKPSRTPASPSPALTATPTPIPQKDNTQPATPAINNTPTPYPTLTSTPLPSVVDAGPEIDGGWQPFGPTTSDRPIMARAAVQPDPTRPYAIAALVRIDLSQVELHFTLGTNEPVAAKGVPPIQRTGNIPATDRIPGKLLAAFNGGFKTIHGNYGVYYQDTTMVPLLDSIGTLAIYQNGRVDIGAWGRDFTMTQELVDARQNCPLLIDVGQINPTVNNENRKEWGYTVKNLDTTWRSGVGLSQDGRFLIYAAGPSLTVETLGRALQMAGAYHAMQLDINGFYTRFATYTPATDPKSKYTVVANKLLNQMTIPTTQFLDPYDRDFFYITARTD